jgi:hypothetical protein
MKVVLISMPDIAAVFVHEAAFHMPNLGIASLGGNLDEDHEVFLIDLIRKRRSVRQYLQRTLPKLRPDVVALLHDLAVGTCLKIVRLVRLRCAGEVVAGGYHVDVRRDRPHPARDIDFLVRARARAFRW